MNRRRTRLDQALVDRGLVASRSRARAIVMAGQVRVAGQPAAKAGMLVGDDDELVVLTSSPFVSRGGEKLVAALQESGIDPADRICLDVGASTGGFTDCLLQAGARQVLAVDVGYGQLDWGLRQDDRVHVLERTNVRYLTADDLPGDLEEPPSLLVVDVSFIGLAKVLPAIGELCAPTCEALVLVKPQFECGPDQVGSGGVVLDESVRRETLESVAGAAIGLGWTIIAAIPSPLRGAAGNWECFLQLARPQPASETASLDLVLEKIIIPSG